MAGRKHRRKKKPLITDSRAPRRTTIKVNGKTLKIKQKQHYDKGRFDTEMREG